MTDARLVSIRSALHQMGVHLWVRRDRPVWDTGAFGDFEQVTDKVHIASPSATLLALASAAAPITPTGSAPVDNPVDNTAHVIGDQAPQKPGDALPCPSPVSLKNTHPAANLKALKASLAAPVLRYECLLAKIESTLLVCDVFDAPKRREAWEALLGQLNAQPLPPVCYPIPGHKIALESSAHFDIAHHLQAFSSALSIRLVQTRATFVLVLGLGEALKEAFFVQNPTHHQSAPVHYLALDNADIHQISGVILQQVRT